MPTYTANKPPVVTSVQLVGASGTTTTYGLASGGSQSYTKPAAVKRQKPKDLRAQSSQTPWSQSSFDCWGNVCTPRTVSMGGPNYAIYTDAMSDHFALDYVEYDDLPYLDWCTVLGNKAVASLKNGYTNLANMLGEYRQSAKLFADLTPRFAAITLAVAQKDPKLFTRAMGFNPRLSKRTYDAKRASELLLQWRYGLSPLLSDVHNSMKQLRDRVERPIEHPIDVSHKDTFSRDWFTTSKLDVPIRVECRSTGRRVDRLKGCYRLKNDLLLQGLGQYGMTNPLSLTWELLPFSFVADWWFNLGDVLSSLDHTLYIESAMGNLVSRQSYVTTARIYGGTSWARSQSYSRSPMVPPTRATLAYKPSVSSVHIQNGLALLTVALFNIYRRKH